MAENETPLEETMEGGEGNENSETPIEQFFFHQRRALEETRKALEALLPPGFKEHSKEAGREFVKGFRVLLDATIDELKKVSEQAEEETQEDDGGEDRPSTTGKTKVKVQVD